MSVSYLTRNKGPAFQSRPSRHAVLMRPKAGNTTRPISLLWGNEDGRRSGEHCISALLARLGYHLDDFNPPTYPPLPSCRREEALVL